MGALIGGLVAGYGIAIPVGAIAVLIIQMGMRCGARVGFMAGAGAATADLVYASVAVVAGAAVARGLEPYSALLRLASGCVLVGLALRGFRHGLLGMADDERTAEVCGAGRMYFQFLGLTIINPLTVVYFGALILGRDHSVAVTATERALFILGAGIASLSWQTLLAGMGVVARNQLSPRFRTAAVILGNVIVLTLGLWVLANALT